MSNSVDKCIYLSGNKQINLAQKIAPNFKQQTISRWKQQGFFPPRYHRIITKLFPEITERELMEEYYQAIEHQVEFE